MMPYNLSKPFIIGTSKRRKDLRFIRIVRIKSKIALYKNFCWTVIVDSDTRNFISLQSKIDRFCSISLWGFNGDFIFRNIYFEFIIRLKFFTIRHYFRFFNIDLDYFFGFSRLKLTFHPCPFSDSIIDDCCFRLLSRVFAKIFRPNANIVSVIYQQIFCW